MLKAKDLVLLTREDGEIPLAIPGFGLFYRDTCYLASYALRLHGTAPLLLMSSDQAGMAAQIGLTNSHLLTANGRTIAAHTSVTSNAAQVLWTGIATVDHARRIAARVIRPDMFSGWGIRTLSSDHAAFDPLAYQQGNVWPFDNALIVSGLRRYGEDAAALCIAGANLDAARGFRNGRLPEFIAGSQRLPGDAPTHTPRADPLQAWSAAAMPFMISELLGLRADGFAKTLHVTRPRLPEGVDTLELHRLRVGRGTVSLRFDRLPDGASVIVVGKSGDVEVAAN